MLGQPEAWFNAVNHNGKSYRSMCKNIVLEFFDDFVPCSFKFRDLRVSSRYLPCDLRRKTHGNMHRHTMLGRSAEHKGEFESHFRPGVYNWPARVLAQIEELEDALKSEDPNERRHGWMRPHQYCVRRFFDALGGAWAFKNNAICLCCLSNSPEHHLDCQHVICTPCAIDSSGDKDCTQIVVHGCPICDDTNGYKKVASLVIPRPPSFSGQRVLVLDGYCSSL